MVGSQILGAILIALAAGSWGLSRLVPRPRNDPPTNYEALLAHWRRAATVTSIMGVLLGAALLLGLLRM